MKRKADSGENTQPGGVSCPAGDSSRPVLLEKRRRVGVSVAAVDAPNKPKRTSKQWRCEARKREVDPDLLEDLGLNIIEDSSSRDSSSSSGIPPPVLYQHVNVVLKPKDTNVPAALINPAEVASPYYISEESGSCHLKCGSLPQKSSSLHLHSYALTAHNTIPDDFFLHTRRTSQCLRRHSIDVFSKMSDEVVLLVFKWLPKVTLAKCALVCKRWYRLSQDESLWKRLDLGIRTVPPGVVGQIMSRGCSVLRLARATLVSPVFVSPVTGNPTFPPSSLCKLQFLDLSMTVVEVPCLERLLACCRSLRKLALENVRLSEACCLAIGRNRNLEVLHLAMSSGFTPAGLSSILNGCDKITELNLSWAELTDTEARMVCAGITKKIERLCFAGYRDKIQDCDIENLVRRATGLRELDLSDATLLTSQTVSLIVEHLPRLESLSTSRCYKISPSSYLLLGACPTLLYLNVFGLLRDPALEELKSKLPGIEVNRHLFTSIARPTVGIRRTSIWELRVRD